jgi:hypothetical protein
MNDSSLFRYERSIDRGRRLVATTDIHKGQLLFVERPLIALQSMGNACDGALVCSYCMSFCGSPKQAIQIAADPSCLQKITTSATSKITSVSGMGEYNLIPCRHKCGHVYCRGVDNAQTPALEFQNPRP